MTEDILNQLRAERETDHVRAVMQVEVLRAERDTARADVTRLANRVLELKAELSAERGRAETTPAATLEVCIKAARDEEREQCAREAEQSISPEAAARSIRARAHLGVKTSP